MIRCPPPTRATHAGLDLVEDEQRSGVIADLPGGGEVAVGGHDDAALALDGLEQHGRHALVDGGGQRLDVAERDQAELGHERLERRPEGLTASGRQGEAGVTVVAVHGRDDPVSTRRPTGQLQGEVDGLAAARAEHRAGQVTGRDLGQALG